ncbi:hypothetical protein K3495_g8506 [Podosphaera aphanis]|nr:hypothetical protein K3495_g8506 [Podosphaera aphanis]
MSPSAITGNSPHTRSTYLNGEKPTEAMIGDVGSGTQKISKRVMMHHDDLIATTANIDINSPIGTILRECEKISKAADTSLNFKRPDIALQEYLQVSIIATEIIPRHKEYPALQVDRPELYKVYIALTKKLKNQNARFMDVKDIVKQNNLFHGTKSAISKENKKFVSSNGNKDGTASSQVANVSATNGYTKKQPPVIHRKPEALQGQAVQNSTKDGKSEHFDLATRFARLRSSSSSPNPNGVKQDPRIRTQPIASHIPNSATSFISGPHQIIPVGRPAGPREMPLFPKIKPRINKIPLDVEIPDLPRAPDAIYSPARGTETVAISNLPSSVRNNSYLGNGQKSAPPISKVAPSQFVVDARRNFESPISKSKLHPDTPSEQKYQIIDMNSTSVTCEQLVKLLALEIQPLKILLVDLRSREDFDNGHIMSQSIICVEPITLRPGISGDELADSMVIAPDAEQKLYEKRDNFDLVIVYDQSSEKITDSSKLMDFTNAVYKYGYEKRLKRPTLLLAAGLNGWIDLLGPNSLATSTTGSSITTSHSGLKLARPLAPSMARDPLDSLLRKQRRHNSRPLTIEQEAIWANTIKEDLANNYANKLIANNELIYARTTEDFIRRYPELPVQESMISPNDANLYQSELTTTVPRPPARPAPAIPRQRSSGISDKSDALSYPNTVVDGDSTISDNRRPAGLTGLANPGVLCYMNTVIQGLSATPWFRELIRNYVHPADPPIPKKQGESTDPPQLMVQYLSSVFAHLWFGHYEFINPTTFQGYVNAVHNRGQGGFGGTQVQHDCNEFLVMLIDILDDELNPLRDRPGRRPIEEIESSLEKAPTILDAAAIYWADWTSNLGSPITQRMKGISARIITCKICGKSRPVFDQFQQLLLAIPPDGSCSLNEVLDANYGPNSELIEYQSLECSKCGQKTAQEGRIYLVYMPETLIISLMRMTNALSKIKTRVTVPLTVRLNNNVVIDQYNSKNQDSRGIGPFVYDVYGLGLHSGNTLASGHYRMLARSLDQLAAGKPAGAWHMFNDRIVTPYNVAAVDPSEISLIFLQRQGK